MGVENDLKQWCSVALSTISHNQHKIHRLSETVLCLLELRTVDFLMHYNPVLYSPEMTKVKS